MQMNCDNKIVLKGTKHPNGRIDKLEAYRPNPTPVTTQHSRNPTEYRKAVLQAVKTDQLEVNMSLQ
jgi:hypothetical protein